MLKILNANKWVHSYTESDKTCVENGYDYDKGCPQKNCVIILYSESQVYTYIY